MPHARSAVVELRNGCSVVILYVCNTAAFL